MKRVFQNGIYLAFTGTPLLKREKSTYKKFGGEIHRYTIDEAVSDKAVLPLLYEGRMANQWINDKMGLDNNFQKITKDLNESEKADLKRKWTRFQKIASSSRRLEVIADDITDHFKKNLKNTPFKAMLATSSKYDALKYKEIFDRDGEIKSAVVISSPDMRQGESSFDSENRDFVINSWKRVIKNYSSVDRYEDEIKESFKEGDIELLIVVDKLLTGFDAPKAKVLYLDKELKEHNLLQAIARVNRVYQGKDNGLIIDYRGLLGELDSALTNYSSLSGFDEEDLKGAVFDIKEEIKKVKSLYKKLKELFKNVKFKDDMESYEISLKDKKKRELFYKYLGEFSRLLNLALGSSKLYDVLSRDEIKEYKEAVKFYRKLQNAVKLRYHEKVDFKKYESSMQKLLNTFISSNEVLETVEPVDIFDINFDKTIEHLTSDSAKADAIFSATTAYIRENLDRNPKFYQKLSDEIEKIIKRYKDKRISERDKLKYAKDIKRQLLKEEFDEYPKELNSILEKSLFDNLKDEFESLNLNQDILIKFIKSVAEVVEDISKKPDWRETKSKELEGEIEELLYNIEDNFNIEFDLDTITPKIIKVILANR
jgi:type I restriction enzyme R subunit